MFCVVQNFAVSPGKLLPVRKPSRLQVGLFVGQNGYPYENLRPYAGDLPILARPAPDPFRILSAQSKLQMRVTNSDFEAIAVPEFTGDEVHVWHVRLAGVRPAEERWASVLSADEKERARRFRFEKDRQNYVAIRALLRLILASYAASAPEQLEFVYSKAGKPSLNCSNVRFNLSHSGDLALLAFAKNREVGIDVEFVRRNVEIETIARRFFSPHEQQELAAIDGDERYDAFFRCWTRKEAYLKAIGAGLSIPLSGFDVSLAPGIQDCLLKASAEQSPASSWRVRDLSPSDGYAAALCAEGRDWTVRNH